MAPPNKTITNCRLCNSDQLTSLYDFGEQYVNNFVSKEEVDSNYTNCPKCRLELVLCENCTLVQLRDTAPQELLYRKYYHYRSGITKTMRVQLLDVVTSIVSRMQLQDGDVWLDIGANDGTLLSYVPPTLTRVAVEPAENLRRDCEKHCEVMIPEIWPTRDLETEDSLKEFKSWVGSPKVITAAGMFYDLDEPQKFVNEVARVLDTNGVFVAQLMCLRNMLNMGDVSNVCHEHLEHYSWQSLEYMMEKAGLEIFDVETVPVNGESYRLWIRHKVQIGNSGPQRIAGSVDRCFQAEDEDLLCNEVESYAYHFADWLSNRDKCVDFIKTWKAKGKSIWILGASTKGNSLLQWYGLDHTLITGASDRDQNKWGKYTVGTGIPIYSEDYARKQKVDYYLVLPYTFRAEILEREKEFLAKGGRMIFPLPQFEVV